jgi:hypothetical protein
VSDDSDDDIPLHDRLDEPGYIPGYRPGQAIGLDPQVPRAGPAPGGITPSFGARVPRDKVWRFDYHGRFNAGLSMGIGTRARPAAPGQASTPLHVPPIVPTSHFENTFAVPGTAGVWAYFDYGNSDVTAHIGFGNSPGGYAVGALNPANYQFSIGEAYLRFLIPKLDPFRVEIRAGAIGNIYGGVGEYGGIGHYWFPLGTLSRGMGYAARGDADIGENLNIYVEHGIGVMPSLPKGFIQDTWNGYPGNVSGTSLLHHAHIGATVFRRFQVRFNYLTSWSADDTAQVNVDPNTAYPQTSPGRPGGRLSVYEVDTQFFGDHLGHFGIGVMWPVGFCCDGQSFTNSFLGARAQGSGALWAVSTDYLLSLGRLLRYPEPFWGEGADLRLSVFGIWTHAISTDPDYSGLTSLKYGADLEYAALPWLTAGVRADRVVPSTRDSSRSFSVLVPRLVFRSSWQSRETLVLQYSQWFYGSGIYYGANRSQYNVTNEPYDDKMFAIQAYIWW